MDGSVLTQLAALPRLSVNEPNAKWEDLMATASPHSSRAFLEFWISGSIEELTTYGGLTRDTRRALDPFVN